ncbi:MAG: NAD(+)/NADH kinase [Lachnospiraceae bacterium]|nr:NAD(+)/NADH kinase [Lachnospiraceae bacterium]
MNKFIIIANAIKTNSKHYVEILQDAIKSNHATQETVWIYDDTDLKESIKDMDFSGMDAAIVVGGDGTMIRAARALRQYDFPFVGVNLGTVGFLCEIDKEHIPESVKRLVENDFEIEQRMMLCGVAETTGRDYALNEIAFGRGRQMNVVSLALYVDGKHLITYRGDGLVIATPTGSTAYSLACGGPILDPRSRMIIVTPIAPHSISSARSIVLEVGVEIEIRPVFRNDRNQNDIVVCFDGTDTYSMTGPVGICKANNDLKMIKMSETGFLDVLKHKL